ncbi:MAG: hypothetical protein ACLPVF_13400 [Acidimicrobiales bacterium]
MKHRLISVVAGCVLLATVGAGCTSARSNLGTSDSSCYLALPAAARAVHRQGRLAGVHLYSLGTLRHVAPLVYQAVAPGHATSQRVCVVEFEGRFSESSVADPHGRTAGRLAVVVTAMPSNRLLGTVLFARTPLHFGHPHVG